MFNIRTVTEFTRVQYSCGNWKYYQWYNIILNIWCFLRLCLISLIFVFKVFPELYKRLQAREFIADYLVIVGRINEKEPAALYGRLWNETRKAAKGKLDKFLVTSLSHINSFHKYLIQSPRQAHVSCLSQGVFIIFSIIAKCTSSVWSRYEIDMK